jgi:RNA polymerase sigma-70 factor (ECF subfamily)
VHPDVEPHEAGADGLVKLFRAGDERALRLIFDQYGPAVFHLATNGLTSIADAEDVTRSAFVAAWTARERFDPERGSLLAWLLGIARRQIADRVRATGPTRRFVGEPSTERVVDQLVLADEMARLPGEQRRVLELAFYDDLTHQQIAAVTGLPRDTVRSHLRGAMIRLLRRWEVDGVASGARSAGAPGPR